MPIPPKPADGGPDDSEDQFSAAEAAHLAARETARIDPSRPSQRATERISQRATERIGPSERIDVAQQSTELIDPAGRETVKIGPEELARRETVRMPAPRGSVDQAGRAPLIVAAGFAAVWAALVSYVPVAAVIGLARTLEGAGGIGGAAQAGLAGWLLGHGVPIGTSIGPLALAPLLLTLLALARLDRAGVHVTRAIGARRTGSWRTAVLVAGMVGFWYAILGAFAAMLINGPGTQVTTSRAVVSFFVLGVLGALSGSLRCTDSLVVLARRVPRVVRHGLRTGVVAALLMLACGAAVAGLSIAVGGGQAADMIRAYRTGVAGQAGITLLSVAYGPNAAVWATAYLLGPGFLLGTGSGVRLTEVTVGPLPTVPLLAGLPGGPMGAAGAALLAVPALAGLAAGWLLNRRLTRPRPPRPGESAPPRREPPWLLVIGSAALAGPVAGLMLGVLAWASGGSLGDGRMAEIGPVPWQVALVGAGVVAVAATIGAALGRAFRAPRQRL